MAFQSSERQQRVRAMSRLTASKGANEKNSVCESAGAVHSGRWALQSPGILRQARRTGDNLPMAGGVRL